MAMAAYEAALELVQEPSAFAGTSSLPRLPPFLFRVTGMDEAVSWPLCAAQAAQIAALYPDKIISEPNIHLNARYADNYNRTIRDIIPECVPQLVPSNGAFMDFSHKVVDDVGDADLFRLQPSDNEANTTTFGVLIVLLPSAHTGGVLTFTYGNHSKTFDDDESLVETSFAAAFLSTTITSAPITSGRRAALVYRLFYGNVKTPMRMEPNLQDAAVAAFQELGQSTTQEVQRLGLELEGSRLNFAALTVWEMAFVKVLLAAGNFDVGLATLDASKRVTRLLPHPKCSIPASVARGLLGRSIQGFLHKPPPKSNAASHMSLVFWPKRHRVSMVDLDGVVAFVKLRLERGNDVDDGHIGLFDTRELVLGAISCFGVDDAARIKGNQFLWPKASLATMHQIVMALDDVALSAALLHVIAIRAELLWTSEAQFIHGLLAKHGWLPLQSSMLVFVERWAKARPMETIQLLTSLAGLDTESPVCPALRQPFEAELFKRCFDVVLKTPGLFSKRKDLLLRGPAVVKGLCLLEHYVKTTAPELQDANYTSRRLPPILVSAIDAFLFAYPALDSLFCSSAVWHPLKDLGVGLASAVRCQPSLPLPSAMIDKVLAAIQAPMTPRLKIRMAYQQADIAAAVLVLASLSQRLDAALFDILVDIYGLRLLPIVASIASQLPDDAIVGQLVAAYIDASVDTLVDESKWPEPFNHRTHAGRYTEATYTFGADIVVSAVQLLLRFAPDTALAFASRWLQLLPTTLAVLRDRLLLLVPRLDRSSCVSRLLVTTIIDRFAAVPVLPPIVNFATPSPPDLDPAHCNQCNEAHWFLAQADEASVTLCSRGVCPHLARVVNADIARLRIEKSATDHRLEKVRQPGQVSEVEWRAHQDTMQDYLRAAQCVESLRCQGGYEQEDTSDESKTPPAKRVRRA